MTCHCLNCFLSLEIFEKLCDFCERAAILDHTYQGALSPPHISRTPGFATKDQASARDSNAAQGDTQDMEAASANLFRSARVAARTEGQAAPPHVFHLPERLSPPSHGFS